jgi:hypothetical protein
LWVRQPVADDQVVQQLALNRKLVELAALGGAKADKRPLLVEFDLAPK